MVDVDVPADLLGDVLGDLNSPPRQGGRHHAGRAGRQVVSALVPAGELVRYSAELRSLTGGRGRFAVEHHHDEIVPLHLVDRLRERPRRGRRPRPLADDVSFVPPTTRWPSPRGWPR